MSRSASVDTQFHVNNCRKNLQFQVERILIVDFDVHHGQGTQQMFYNDPRVLYFSTHRYEHGTFWPNLRQSDFDYVGEGKGAGYNFNVPLNKTGMTNADFLAIWQQILIPVTAEVRLIFINVQFVAFVVSVIVDVVFIFNICSNLLHTKIAYSKKNSSNRI